MWAALNPDGVPLAAVRRALARHRETRPGTEWPVAEWARIWRRLTATQQRVVYLHVLFDLDFQLTADLLGLSRGSVVGAWRRALDRIRDTVPGIGPAAAAR